MKKAYNLSEELCHSEFTRKQRKRSFLYSVSISESQETLNQVQSDNCRHSELVSESQETLNLARTQFLTLALKINWLRTSLVRLVPRLRYWQVRNDAIKAFTLAEIMIVLSVIAVLAVILLPAARNAMVNKKVVKFKKGHEALYKAVSELVVSDKYYLDGDLGTKINGERLRESKSEDKKYFCETLSDVISAKSSNCIDIDNPIFTNLFAYATYCSSFISNNNYPYDCNGYEVTSEQLQKVKKVIDTGCKTALYSRNIPGKQIVTLDDIWYFDPGPASVFGEIHQGQRIFSSPLQKPPTFYDSSGMDVQYKIFCMDIDGVVENSADCVNECPFGYGIRADGKILNGKRADEWLNKAIQGQNQLNL